MTALRGYVITAAVALLVGVGGALTFAWHAWRPKAIVETPAPAVRQPDSSLVLQRVPDAHAKPAQDIPKGATVERIEHVVVQPRAVTETPPVRSRDSVISPDHPIAQQVTRDTAPAIAPSLPATSPASLNPSAVACPPVGIDLTLIRLKDGTQRVVASSKDGSVLDSLSVDHPVVDVAPARVLAWSAGPVWGGGDNGVGVNVTHDIGFLRIVGAALRAPARGPFPVHVVGLLAVNIRF